jgi:DNA gyrase subunit A
MISDLRDESDRRGMSHRHRAQARRQPKKVLNQLYKYTPLQSTFGVQMLALVDGEPRLLSLKRALQIYIEHRRDVITRRASSSWRAPGARPHPGRAADCPGEPGRRHQARSASRRRRGARTA